jgi:hypothetical protein
MRWIGRFLISLLCPTRGRPDQFKRMVESARDTADGAFNIVAYVDKDDPTKEEYPEWVQVGYPLPLGPAYQYLWEQTKSEIVMMCADDLIFRTKGWDTKVKELMPEDLIGVVSYDDLGRPRKENGHPFIGKKLIQLVGYLCYPKLKHSCVDNWVVDIATGIDRFFYSDLVIEHMHPKYGKGEVDETYFANTKTIKKEDGNIYLGPEGIREISNAVRTIRTYLC